MNGIDWNKVTEAARDGFGYTETVKREGQKERTVATVIAALQELAHQMADPAERPRRPAVGDRVRITGDRCGYAAIGKVGILGIDDGSSIPFCVTDASGRFVAWCYPSELEIVS